MPQTEYPAATNLELVLTSRVTIKAQTLDPADCTLDDFRQDCQFVDDGVAESRYVANFEGYTIRFRHGVRGELVNKSGISTGANAMSGMLQTQSGIKIRQWPGPDFIVDDDIMIRQDENRSGTMCPLAARPVFKLRLLLHVTLRAFCTHPLANSLAAACVSMVGRNDNAVQLLRSNLLHTQPTRASQVTLSRYENCSKPLESTLTMTIAPKVKFLPVMMASTCL